MRYVYDHDLHIHSRLSLCSGDPEETNERILQYARDNRLSTICLTDHFWDETIPLSADSEFYRIQNLAHVKAALPLPQTEGIRFLFGCETEMDRFMTVGVSKERLDEFAFIIVPTTHFHMVGHTIPAEIVSPADKADFWLKKLNALLDCDLPFHKIGIAHLVCGLIDRNRQTFLDTIDAIDRDGMYKAFRRAVACGVGIELNADDMKCTDAETDIVLRPFRIAREVGCSFYMGSDAHHPKALDEAKAIFERAIDRLELSEEEKFILQ